MGGEMLFLGIVRGFLAFLLVVAALWDVRRRRIPNFMSGATLLFGLSSAVASQGWEAFLSGMAACLATILIGWVPWTKGWIGGGDVKLAAAAASAVGLSMLHEYLLATALAGGLVALICYVLSSRSARRDMVANLKLLPAGIIAEPDIHGGAGRVSVPYGVACVAGALFVLFVRKG
jgi:prepilin peptidase CpaA